MSETLVPSVPPVSPFEAYTIIIVLPFLMRLIFVAPPLVDLSNKLMPKEDRGKHARWALDRIKSCLDSGSSPTRTTTPPSGAS